MHRKVEPRELRRQEEIERLVDAIHRGQIAAIEDLDPEQVKLLLSRARPEESFEDLFDRLRQPAREQD